MPLGHGCLDFAGVLGDLDAEQVAPEGAGGVGGQSADQADRLTYDADECGGDQEWEGCQEADGGVEAFHGVAPVGW